MVQRASDYLLSQQNDDGSWGGSKGISGTVEETALAVSALSAYHHDACTQGIEWLISRKEITAAPVGLYFAMLWYDEKLYPLIYYVEALRRYLERS